MNETVLDKKQVYDGKIIKVEKWQSQLQDGRKFEREVVLHHPVVNIIPLVRKDTVLLIQQFRPAAGQMLWEIPAGSVDPDENLEEAAKRELAEETGFGCRWLSKLFSAFNSPGFLNEESHVYLARDLFHAPLKPDEDEQIQVK